MVEDYRFLLSSLIKTVVMKSTTADETKITKSDLSNFSKALSKIITSQIPKIAIKVVSIIKPTKTKPVIFFMLFMAIEFKV